MSHPKATNFLKPAIDGLLVRNPERGGHLKQDGEWVENNVYWFRRKQDGDVVEVTPPKETKTKKTRSN